MPDQDPHTVGLQLQADGRGVVTIDGRPVRNLQQLQVVSDPATGTAVVVAFKADVVGTLDAPVEQAPAAAPEDPADDPREWVRHRTMAGEVWVNTRTNEQRDRPPPGVADR